jgi:hypothetical protein
MGFQDIKFLNKEELLVKINTAYTIKGLIKKYIVQTSKSPLFPRVFVEIQKWVSRKIWFFLLGR